MMVNYVVGVDVGGTTAKIGIFDSGRMPAVVVKTSVPTRTENGGVHILPDIAEAISLLAEEAGVSMEEVSGIGIGVPGPVLMDRDTGHYYVNRCVNLGWGVKDLTAELSELTGIGQEDIAAVNDANAAALGEVMCGGGDIHPDGIAVMVTIGTGIGAGIVMADKVVRGAFGSAGEIGHIKVHPQHPLMAEMAGRMEPFGDLEYFTSATGIANVAENALAVLPDDSVLRNESSPDAKSVFDAAKAGDALALKVTDFFFDTLGIGLGAVAGVVDPDMFIIGGGVSGAGEFLISGLQKAYRKYVFHASADTEFRLAVLGNDAGMIGAACCCR